MTETPTTSAVRGVGKSQLTFHDEADFFVTVVRLAFGRRKV